jgi:hypothetical protein
MNSSTAGMDLPSSVPHEQLLKALQGIVPSLTREPFQPEMRAVVRTIHVHYSTACALTEKERIGCKRSCGTAAAGT